MFRRVARKLKREIGALKKYIEKRQWRAYSKEYDVSLKLSEVDIHFPECRQRYRYFHHLFYHGLPEYVRRHREYFSINRRGFSENAFHAMWWMLFKEYRPEKCLEIGVYRGQIISLWKLLGAERSIPVDVYGISPFTSAGDSVSDYMDIDYEEDIKNNFRHFNLQPARLIRAYSSDDRALEAISSHEWDLVFIDGNHDYEQVTADYLACHAALKVGGLLVFDDAAAELDYTPPRFAFAGHPGPSRLVRERVMNEMKFISSCGHNVVFQKTP